MSMWPLVFGSTRRLVALPNVAPFLFKTHRNREDAFISKSISERGTWEPLETEVVCRLLRVYNTFLDLGANIGWYTKVAQQIMPRYSQIYAFEPEPGNFALLKANTRRARWQRSSPATTLVQAAISDHVGTTEIHLSTSNQGDHRIYASEKGRRSVVVPVTTIDDYFMNQRLPPLLLKSDTQGSEPRILRGSKRALSANLATSAIIIEFWPHGMEASGENVEAFIIELAKLPHRPLLIDNEMGCLRPIDWNDLATRCKQDLAPATGSFVDLLLLPNGEALRAVQSLMAA